MESNALADELEALWSHAPSIGQLADWLSANSDAIITALRAAEPAEPGQVPHRKQFPVLGSQGVSVDWQFVADHGRQANANHYQTVERLAKRGGLSWCELCAVIEDRQYSQMETADAILRVRASEAKYLDAAVFAQGRAEAGAWPNCLPLGTRVTKRKGSSWQGAIVGYYSTNLTPRGYAVESEREPGSVQIYPEAALEPVEEPKP